MAPLDPGDSERIETIIFFGSMSNLERVLEEKTSRAHTSPEAANDSDKSRYVLVSGALRKMDIPW